MSSLRGQSARVRRGRHALPGLLTLALLLVALGFATAASRFRGGSNLARRRSAAEQDPEPMHARGRRMQTGYWIRNSGCPSSSYCSSNGWCESASTWTTTRGCGSSKTVSTRESASSSCRTAGCGYANCNSDEIEVSSTWCWYPPSYNERCCKKIITSTCRDWLGCEWRSYPSPPPPEPRRSPPPPPPPPPRVAVSSDPSIAVFGAGGAWDAAAASDKPVNAWIAAILANHAYETLGGSGFTEWANRFRARVGYPMGVTRSSFHTRPGTDTQWYLLETRDTIFVVFRGTESFLDFVVDTYTYLEPAGNYFGSNAKIVGGFLKVFTENLSSFMEKFNAITGGTSTTKKIWLTGHSLGGALAVLFAAHLQMKTPYYVQGVYTFGSPRVGNDDWVTAYGSLGRVTYRYEVALDFITTWPSVVGYKHVGTMVTLNGLFCPNSGRRRAVQSTTNSTQKQTSTVASPSPPPALPADLCASVEFAENGTAITHIDNCTSTPSTVNSNATTSSKYDKPAPRPAPSSPMSELAPLDTLDAGDQPAASNSTSGTETRSGTKYINHSMQDNYMNLVYNCRLSSSERNRVPSFSWASNPP